MVFVVIIQQAKRSLADSDISYIALQHSNDSRIDSTNENDSQSAQHARCMPTKRSVAAAQQDRG